MMSFRFVALVILCFFSFRAFAETSADQYFNAQQYKNALQAYKNEAEQGHPKAFYQLGVIYYKGLGVWQDQFYALLWFSLAADSGYGNANEIVTSLLVNASEAEKEELQRQKARLLSLLSASHETRGYLPQIKHQGLEGNIAFGKQGVIDPAELLEEIEELGLDVYATSFDPETGDLDETFAEQELSTPFYLIAEYDIAPDGSIRNIVPIYENGDIKYAINDLKRSKIEPPTFNQENVHFTSRSYFGIANYNRYRMKQRYYNLYRTLRKQRDALAQSDSPHQQLKYLKLLSNFPWLITDEKDFLTKLEQSAQHGYPYAAFLLGMNLYQRQVDVEQGIKWITQAAKYEVLQAQYRLGHILRYSPWVVNDERKALFWFDRAKQQGHVFATLQASEIRLDSEDSQLIDIELAKADLSKLASEQGDNPQFHYLTALALKKQPKRDLYSAVKSLRHAISEAKDLNWDTSHWQALLERWTSNPSVTVRDLDSDQ